MRPRPNGFVIGLVRLVLDCCCCSSTVWICDTAWDWGEEKISSGISNITRFLLKRMVITRRIRPFGLEMFNISFQSKTWYQITYLTDFARFRMSFWCATLRERVITIRRTPSPMPTVTANPSIGSAARQRLMPPQYFHFLLCIVLPGLFLSPPLQ